jgi:hypothetical protein
MEICAWFSVSAARIWFHCDSFSCLGPDPFLCFARATVCFLFSLSLLCRNWGVLCSCFSPRAQNPFGVWFFSSEFSSCAGSEDFVSISAAEGIRSALPPCSVRCYCSCPRSSSGPWCAPFCLLMSRERRSVRITCSLCCLILRGLFYVEVGIVFELSDQKIKFF